MSDLFGERKPWSYVAHKDGEWIGIISADIGVPSQAKSWAREVKDFIAEAIMDGQEIFTAYSREDHEAFLKTKEMYRMPHTTSHEADHG